MKPNTKECIYLLKFMYKRYIKFKTKHDSSLLLVVRRVDPCWEEGKRATGQEEGFLVSDATPFPEQDGGYLSYSHCKHASSCNCVLYTFLCENYTSTRKLKQKKKTKTKCE